MTFQLTSQGESYEIESNELNSSQEFDYSHEGTFLAAHPANHQETSKPVRCLSDQAAAAVLHLAGLEEL